MIITSPTNATNKGDTSVQADSITLTQCSFAKSASDGGFKSAFSIALGI